MPELKRTLSLAEVVFFASGVILGAGIYTVVGKAAGAAGNMLWLSFVIAAVTALLSLFSYAELCSIFPSAGGEYTYVKNTAGERWANIVGVMVALSAMVSAATISLGFAGYFSDLTSVPRMLTAPCVVLLIFLLNVSGIRNSSSVNIAFTIIETLGLLFVIVSAAPSFGEIRLTDAPPSGIPGILTGAAICFFAFTGFEDAVKLAEETKSPEKTIPKALFISAGLVGLLYLIIAVLSVGAVPFEELNKSESPLSLIVKKRFGSTGALIIGIVALFSTANSLLSNMMGASRVIYTFGKNNHRLHLFGKVLSSRKTPYVALLVAAIVIMSFSLVGKVKVVALITNFFMFITFLIMNATLIYLRVNQPHFDRPFQSRWVVGRIPITAILAVVFILVLITFAVTGLAQGMTEDF